MPGSRKKQYGSVASVVRVATRKPLRLVTVINAPGKGYSIQFGWNTPSPLRSAKTRTHRPPVGVVLGVDVLVGVAVDVAVGVVVAVGVDVGVGVLVGVGVAVGGMVGVCWVTARS
jgi:hypothetical protein